MNLLHVLIFVIFNIVTLTIADSGYYVPRAFYTIDNNGKPSPWSFIDPYHQDKILVRVRRSPQVSSSSSASSSSSSSNGGPVFFTQSTSHRVNGQPAYYPSGQSAFVQPPVSLNQRFGDDTPATGYSGTYTGTSNGGNGVFTQTSGIIYPDGHIDYNSNTGKFKK